MPWTEHFKLCQGNFHLIPNQCISLDKALGFEQQAKCQRLFQQGQFGEGNEEPSRTHRRKIHHCQEQVEQPHNPHPPLLSVHFKHYFLLLLDLISFPSLSKCPKTSGNHRQQREGQHDEVRTFEKGQPPIQLVKFGYLGRVGRSPGMANFAC
jgi:hypothetical protein